MDTSIWHRWQQITNLPKKGEPFKISINRQIKQHPKTQVENGKQKTPKKPMDRDIQKKKKTPAKNNVHAQELQEIKEKKTTKYQQRFDFYSPNKHISRSTRKGIDEQRRERSFSAFFLFFLASCSAFNRQPWDGGGGVECWSKGNHHFQMPKPLSFSFPFPAYLYIHPLLSTVIHSQIW